MFTMQLLNATEKREEGLWLTLRSYQVENQTYVRIQVHHDEDIEIRGIFWMTGGHIFRSSKPEVLIGDELIPYYPIDQMLHEMSQQMLMRLQRAIAA